MGNVFFFGWEIRLMVLLQSVSSGVLTALAVAFTMLGEEYLMILLLGLTYWCIDKELGRRVSLALSGTIICGSMLKGIAQRRRPYMDNSEIRCVRAAHPGEDLMSPVAQGFSMPSLHAAMSASVFGSLAHETGKKPLRVSALILPFFIGLSRIYLGVHYPTDVLSGWVLGAGLMLLFSALEHKRGYRAGFVTLLAVGALGFLYCRDNEFYSCWGITLGLFAGFLYEEKYVGFEKAVHWWSFLLRPVLGVAAFAVVSALLKLPAELITGEMAQLFYRLFRYALSTFVIIGLYPHLFNKLRFL